MQNGHDTDSLRKELEELRRRIFQMESANRSAVGKTDDALREMQKRYLELVDNANDAIYMTDAKGFFILVNPAALRITGYSQEEIIGKFYLDLIHPHCKDRVEEFYKTQLPTRPPIAILKLQF